MAPQSAQIAAKTAKPAREKKPPVALTARVTQQLDRAVLARTVTKEELDQLSAHITKLQAFLE